MSRCIPNSLSLNNCWRLGLWLLLFVAAEASADVYRRVGRDGQIIFTDRPAGHGYELVIGKGAGNHQKKVTVPEKPSVSMVHHLKNGQVILGNGSKSSPAPRPFLVTPARPATVGYKAQEYSQLIERAAYQHGVDPWLLHAVIRAESAYNPSAISSKGAMGLMQLMPGTAARYGVTDPYNPEQNILGGARYLKDLLGMFGSDVRLAVAAYNAGEGNVQKYGYQVPPFEETRGYVSKVLNYYGGY